MGDKIMPRPLTFLSLPPNSNSIRVPLPAIGRPAGVEGVMEDFPRRKRSRITRACDTCRKKKIRCDMESGNPCTTCKIYGWECTFLEQAKKRGPSKGYIDSLENRLKKMEALLENLNHKEDSSSKSRHKRSLSPQTGEESYDDQDDGEDESDDQNRSPESEGNKLSGMPNKDATITNSSTHEYTSSKSHHHRHKYPAQSTQEVVPSQQSQLDAIAKSSAAVASSPMSNISSPSLDHPTPSSSSSNRVSAPDCINDRGEYRETRFMGSTSGLTFLNGIVQRSGANRETPDPSIFPYSSHTFGENDQDTLLVNMNTILPDRLPEFTLTLPKDIADKLVDIYFTMIFNTLPILNKNKFMRHYRSEADPPPTLLLMAIYTVTIKSLYPDDAVFQKHTEITQKGLIERLDKLIPLLLSHDMTEHGISTVQALILLSTQIHFNNAKNQNWLHAGMAIRLSQELGLHRNSEICGIPKAQTELRKRIWWACFILDRWSSMSLGRPMVILDEDCDMEMPTAEFDEDDEDAPKTEEERREWITVIAAFNAFIKLTTIAGNTVRTIYSRKKKETNTQATVKRLTDELTAWRAEAPTNLHCNVFAKSYVEISEFSARLEICYNIVFLLIHRPYIMPHDSEVTSSKPFLSALGHCTSSANVIVHVADLMLKCGLLKFSWNFVGYGIFQSIIVHLHNATSTDSRLSVPAKFNLQISMGCLEVVGGPDVPHLLIKVIKRVMDQNALQFPPQEDYDAFVRAQNQKYKPDNSSRPIDLPMALNVVRPPHSSATPHSSSATATPPFISISPRIPISDLPRGPKLAVAAPDSVGSTAAMQSSGFAYPIVTAFPPSSSSSPPPPPPPPPSSSYSDFIPPSSSGVLQGVHSVPVPWLLDPSMLTPTWLSPASTGSSPQATDPTALFADPSNSFWEMPLVFDFQEWENWIGQRGSTG